MRLELEEKKPFMRVIHAEELWQYRHPMTYSYVPTQCLWIMVALLPLSAVFLNYMVSSSEKGFERPDISGNFFLFVSPCFDY